MTGIVHDYLQWKFVNYKSKSFNYLLKGTSKLERISRFLTLTLVLDSFVPSARVMDREKI